MRSTNALAYDDDDDDDIQLVDVADIDYIVRCIERATGELDEKIKVTIEQSAMRLRASIYT